MERHFGHQRYSSETEESKALEDVYGLGYAVASEELSPERK